MRESIINQDDIALFLEGLAEGQEPLAGYLMLALRKAIIKEPAFFKPVTDYPANPPAWLTREKFESSKNIAFDPERTKGSSDALRHIRDWIAGAIASDDAWLKDVDDRGRPQKLLQIGSLARAYAMAEKDMNKKTAVLRSHFGNSASLFEEDEAAGHIKTVHIFENGSRMVQLLTSHALDIETAQLGHCIGNGGYDADLLSADKLYYSLRDPLNKAHVTLEVVHGKVEQFKGKKNEPPIQQYMLMGQDFIRSQKWTVSESARHTGLLEKGGVYYDARYLPEGFSWEGNIDLEGAKWLRAIPRNLTTSGGLNLEKCTGLTSLPSNLSVGEALKADYCTGLTSVGDNISVGRHFYLSVCNRLTSIGNNISVHGVFVAEECKALTTLGNNISVGMNLHLADCTALISLGENLSVGGNLDLEGCTGLRSLPEHLSVGGAIFWNDEEYKTVEQFRAAFEKVYPKKEAAVPPSAASRFVPPSP